MPFSDRYICLWLASRIDECASRADNIAVPRLLPTSLARRRSDSIDRRPVDETQAGGGFRVGLGHIGCFVLEHGLGLALPCPARSEQKKPFCTLLSVP